MTQTRRPLVLTGGPAVGKSTCAALLARRRPRGAYVDVDDLRQLVVAGSAAPWDGDEGARQRVLSAVNACALTRNLTDADFDTVIADVLDPTTAAVYRREIPSALVLHLRISLAGARSRAATRRVYLTDDEFTALHDADHTAPPDAEVVLDVDGLTIEQQVAAVAEIWAGAGFVSS